MSTTKPVGTFPFQAYLRLTLCFLVLQIVDMKDSKPTVRLCLILPENDPSELQAMFETLLEDVNKDVAFPVQLKAVTLIWGQNNRPLFELWSGIQNIIDLNVTGVISFLPSSRNKLLLFLLSDTSLPVIGLDNEDHQWNTALEKSMYVSIRPPEALQASVIKDLLLEYEQSRFICITTNAAKGDTLWRQLFRYVSTSAEPRCIVIQEQRLAAIEEVYATLAAITASGVKVIVVHCPPQESKKIIFLAQKLNLKRLADDFVWIFSDQAKENNASEYPDGSIGISKLQWPGGTHDREYFLRDSVQVLVKALATTVRRVESAVWLQCPQTELFVSFKRHLYREILSGSHDGETGPIEFNTHGERITSKFIISKVVTSLDKRPHWHRIGSSTTRWDPRVSPRLFETFLPRDLPQPRHLRIVTIEHEPFTMVRPSVYSSMMGASCPTTSVLCTKFVNSTFLFHDTEPHSLLCCYGAGIDILLKMQQQTGFTFTLVLVKDGKYGSYDPDERKMNGMIGDLVRGDADLAIGLITITEERAKFVDFTIPYREVALTFLVKSNKRRKYAFAESIGDMRLMKPFSMELWFACVATFFAVSLTVWLMEKFTCYRRVKSSYLLPFEFAAYVFGNIFHVPLTKISAKTFAVPVLMVIANCGALVLVSSYTANLLVSLIVVEETSLVSGVADIKLTNPPDGFTFGTVRDSSAEDFFKKSSSPKLRRIYNNMKNVDSYSEGIQKIQSGELTAFISESEPLLSGKAEDGSFELKLDGKQFDLAGLAFALPKNSQWTSEFSRAIQKLNSWDGIDVIFKKWTKTGCESRGDHSAAHAFRMGLDEFGGFLFNTFVICFGCFLILLLEILVHKKITRNHQHLNFWKGTAGSKSTIILQ